MHKQIEKQHKNRAVELGNSGDPDALPEYDVYVEYWGMDTTDYKIGMMKKQKLYQQQGKRLISLYPEDKASMRKISYTN